MVKNYKGMSLKLPVGLHSKIVVLANKAHLNPHAYVIKTLWTVTQWDGKNLSPNNGK